MYIYMYTVQIHTCISVLRKMSVRRSADIHTHVWCSVVQCDAVWCSALQCVAVCCSVLQCLQSADIHTHISVAMLIHIYQKEREK